MEISALIERNNRMLELLEYTNLYPDYDELVSLKISVNNLLAALDDGGANFFQVLMLSSPVLFDFAFNSKLDEVGAKLRRGFEKHQDYEEAKKWYKFIRNSLIHTNRYTYNNFLDAIYRIEYSDGAYIYFDIRPERMYRYQEFKANKFFKRNEKANIELDGFETYEYDLDIKMRINYVEFRKFVLKQTMCFIIKVEKEIDKILIKQLKLWDNYYKSYRELIKDVYEYKQIDISMLKRVARNLGKITDFNIEQAYILCEYLVYIRDLEYDISEEQMDDMIILTTFDKYAQLKRRTIIMNQISNVRDYVKKYVDYDLVAWLLNEIHPLTSTIDSKLEILEHTNYLIMYSQKYLTVKGVIDEQ